MVSINNKHGGEHEHVEKITDNVNVDMMDIDDEEIVENSENDREYTPARSQILDSDSSRSTPTYAWQTVHGKPSEVMKNTQFNRNAKSISQFLLNTGQVSFFFKYGGLYVSKLKLIK